VRQNAAIPLRTAPAGNRDTRVGPDCQQAGDHGTPELDDSRYNLIRSLVNQDFVSADQGDHRIRVAFDKLDQIGVHGDLLTVQTGKLNHVVPLRKFGKEGHPVPGH
jgi:hypothetical protein